MHVKSLKVFCDVVALKSFSRAAKENGMSQSGASQAVHQLEQHLSVKLIDRSKRPFSLTAEGEVFYDGARKLVTRYQALEDEVRSMNSEVSGKIRVASIYSIGLSHLNACVKRFLTTYPQANVRVEYQHPDTVYELVENDQADLGLISYPQDTRLIQSRTWSEEPMVLVCAPSHPLASRRRVAVGDLQGCDMVAFDLNLKIRREIDRVLDAHGVRVKVAMEFDNIETIKQAIEINSGVALLPAPCVAREVAAGALCALELTDVDLRRPLGIIQRKGKPLCRTAEQFLNMLLQQAEAPAAALSAAASSAAASAVKLVAAEPLAVLSGGRFGDPPGAGDDLPADAASAAGLPVRSA